MSDIIDKNELFYKECKRMFAKAIARVIDNQNLSWKRKFNNLKKIYEYIDIAGKGVKEK